MHRDPEHVHFVRVCVCVCLCLCVPVCVSVFVGEVFVPITLMFLTVIHANSTVVLMYNVV